MLSVGSQSCAIAMTNALGVAQCTLTITQPVGLVARSARFAGTQGFVASTTPAGQFNITAEETSLRLATGVLSGGTSLVANGRPATLTMTLKEGDGTPIGGKNVTGFIGTQSCGGTTASAGPQMGTATCVIPVVNQPLGPVTVGATFTDAAPVSYAPATTTGPGLLFEYLTRGSFVVGGPAATMNGNVTLWSPQWAKANHMASTSPSFKGFAGTLASNPPAVGQNWSASPGNSGNPPSTVPSYMAVIVANSVAKNGSVISGDTAKMMIVKMDPAPNMGDSGTGTGKVVAQLGPAL